MNSAEQSFKKTLTFYFECHHKLNDFYSVAKYFFNPGSAEEQRIVKDDPFFIYVAYACWEVVVIDLCKIFSQTRSQKHNIVNFLSSMKSSSSHAGIRSLVGEAYIDECLVKIDTFKPTIDKLKLLRDKYYAHLDDLTLDPNTLKNPTFVETEALFTLLKEIITELNGRVFDTLYEFREPSDSDNLDVKAILKDIAKVRLE